MAVHKIVRPFFFYYDIIDEAIVTEVFPYDI
jgi:hypothetical protein